MGKVLVVGGAGYVGGWLADRAIEAGHDVRVYDLLLYEDRYLKDVPFVAGDVLDRERLRPAARLGRRGRLARGARGRPGLGARPARSPARSTSSRSSGSATYFDGRIVFPSTCSVYGAQDDELDEDSPTAPLSLYAETKLEAERDPARARPDSLILRLATLAGVGDTYSRIRLDLVVNLLVARAKLIGELQVFGGAQYRPLLHVRDVATAILPAPRDRTPPASSTSAPRTSTILELAERVVDARRRGRDPAGRDAVPGHAQLPRLVRARAGASSASSRARRSTTRSTRSPS